MTTRRLVADRLKSAGEEAASKSQMTIDAAKPSEPMPSHSIYDAGTVRATLVCDLSDYFRDSASTHYAISPPLRHERTVFRRRSLEASCRALATAVELNLNGTVKECWR